ncbi:MAG: UDP-N-acetylglucosamine 2-epimerase (hydrolyzing), partial [Nanoarchaeota archaeon]
GIKEASILGTPVVDIGSRQMNRLKPKNVFWAGWDKYAIQLAIYKQLHNRYEPDYTYYNPKCSDLIVKTFLDFF